MQQDFSSRNLVFMRRAAPYIDWAVVVLVFASGLLNPNPITYYDSLWRIFLIITIPVISLSFLFYRFSESYGQRIQGERNKIPPIAQEAFGTVLAMFVVACLAAHPIALYREGFETGLAWTLEQMGLTWWQAVLQMWLGIILIDALTYWKHRFLHTKLFFAFHKHHHTFRDPTPFASFSVGPLETVLTFFPLLAICFPEAKHYAPLYFTAISGFVFLNMYLHCGVTFKGLEKVLPKIGLNTSAWHNVHHSETNVNFGEVSSIWDKVCKTTYSEKLRKKAQQKKQSVIVTQ